MYGVEIVFVNVGAVVHHQAWTPGVGGRVWKTMCVRRKGFVVVEKVEGSLLFRVPKQLLLLLLVPVLFAQLVDPFCKNFGHRRKSGSKIRVSYSFTQPTCHCLHLSKAWLRSHLSQSDPFQVMVRVTAKVGRAGQELSNGMVSVVLGAATWYITGFASRNRSGYK